MLADLFLDRGRPRHELKAEPVIDHRKAARGKCETLAADPGDKFPATVLRKGIFISLARFSPQASSSRCRSVASNVGLLSERKARAKRAVPGQITDEEVGQRLAVIVLILGVLYRRFAVFVLRKRSVSVNTAGLWPLTQIWCRGSWRRRVCHLHR